MKCPELKNQKLTLTLKFVSPRMSHYACSLCMFIMQVLASQLHFLANKNAELAILPLFWPVKIGGDVALLSYPTVYSLYCDSNINS